MNQTKSLTPTVPVSTNRIRLKVVFPGASAVPQEVLDDPSTPWPIQVTYPSVEAFWALFRTPTAGIADSCSSETLGGSLVKLASRVASERRVLLESIRDALTEGDDTTVILLARELVGLAEASDALG